MPKSLKKKLIQQRKWKARQRKKGIKTDFGRGLVICLVKFSAHFDNWMWRHIQHVDFFYHRLKGNRKKLDHYDRSIADSVAFAEITMPIWKTAEKWISQEIELWANGASDHLYEIKIPKEWEGTKLAGKIEKLQDLGLKMGHGFTGKSWTFNDLENLRKLTEEVSVLIDKKISLRPDKGIYS